MKMNELAPSPLNLPESNAQERKEETNFPFSTKKAGAMTYIVNSTGEPVSNGYHELKVFKHGEMTAFIGKTGAMSVLLKAPENEQGFFQESEEEFHDLEVDDKLGLILIKTGAMKYIIDPETGKTTSNGYHEFFIKNGHLYGRVGAHEEIIETISSLPKITKSEKSDNLISKIKDKLLPKL